MRNSGGDFFFAQGLVRLSVRMTKDRCCRLCLGWAIVCAGKKNTAGALSAKSINRWIDRFVDHTSLQITDKSCVANHRDFFLCDRIQLSTEENVKTHALQDQNTAEHRCGARSIEGVRVSVRTHRRKQRGVTPLVSRLSNRLFEIVQQRKPTVTSSS